MFRSVDRVKLIMSILKCDPNENGAGLVLEKLLKAEIILAAFPLHDRSELQACQSKWLVYWSWPWARTRVSRSRRRGHLRGPNSDAIAVR